MSKYLDRNGLAVFKEMIFNYIASKSSYIRTIDVDSLGVTSSAATAGEYYAGDLLAVCEAMPYNTKLYVSTLIKEGTIYYWGLCEIVKFSSNRCTLIHTGASPTMQAVVFHNNWRADNGLSQWSKITSTYI